MKIEVSFLGFLLAFTANAAPTIQSSSAKQPDCSYPIGKTGINAKVSGRLFDIDGKVEYFAGSNAWWLGHLSNNSDVDTTLQQVVNTGYKILRVWGFGDVNTIPDPSATDPNKVYFQILNSTGSYLNFGPDGLQRLDYVISSAEKYGVKLVLPFINNWGDYGGIAAYGNAFGNNATTFYTNAAAQKAYKAYIKTLVTRYSNSSAIFAWELCNEPRCHGCDTSVITNWATDISSYIKSLDSDHMVTLGDEGWLAPADGYGDGSYAYGGGEGIDFAANLKIKTLDYGVFHLYPNSWGYNYTWGNEWIQQHDAIGAAIGKPVILEEYGTPFPNNHTETEGPWQETVVKSGLAADQIWQFGTYDLSVPGSNLGDVNSIYYNETEYKTLGFEHAKNMLAKDVK
ncbi:glycoside hydrolase [Mollisia scopiformis]|uniref:mannan endo-1,4-beta-mannosidase n=1 Tax=Mollisia scopiformis TaxID=149040 RepID=A0A194X8Z5_MOLSC|nr:glycoside hydrolase [Mollisia scopiformis]KUJ16641.1 glycoside hydrolase [Mollisia scopiformis]